MLRLRGKAGTQLGTIIFFGVRSFVATSTGGSLTFVLGSEWGVEMGVCIVDVLFRASKQASKQQRDLVERFFSAQLCVAVACRSGLKRAKLKLVLRLPTKRVWRKLFF